MFLEISNGRNSTYKERLNFCKDGFEFKNNKWIIEGEKKKLKKLKRKYKWKGFSIVMYNNNVVRSTDYRKTFFIHNKGFNFFHKKYYRCAYCGKPVKKDCITVDHIIPVYKSQRNFSAKILMKLFRIHNINEYENLTPSCKKCNSKKGSKLSINYIYKGITGKFGSGIFIRRIMFLLKFLLFTAVILLLLLIISIKIAP